MPASPACLPRPDLDAQLNCARQIQRADPKIALSLPVKLRNDTKFTSPNKSRYSGSFSTVRVASPRLDRLVLLSSSRRAPPAPLLRISRMRDAAAPLPAGFRLPASNVATRAQRSPVLRAQAFPVTEQHSTARARIQLAPPG
jgi:hypothetical protein